MHAGYSLPHAIRRLDFGGRQLTAHLVQLLVERGDCAFAGGGAERDAGAREMKEKHGYIAANVEEEMKKAAAAGEREVEKNYVLPGGGVITIGNERFRAPEVTHNVCMIIMNMCTTHIISFLPGQAVIV